MDTPQSADYQQRVAQVIDRHRKSLAETVGIPRVTLQRKLDGITAFTVPELGRIGVVFGYTASELLEHAERAA